MISPEPLLFAESRVRLVLSELRFRSCSVPLYRKLSTVLDFQLRFDSDSDPLVTLDATQRAEELPARLAPSGNVTMMLERDPRCSDRQRIVKVWVLPGGSAGAPRTSVASVQSDEQARQAKDGAEMILRAHGMDASGQPLPQ